ncbi:MAG: hypothetical protein JWL59_1347 [Chthoniobacteraceae bacterium]|nr:hypothetical protein [Chthoniobacteraceae bacterium]
MTAAAFQKLLDEAAELKNSIDRDSKRLEIVKAQIAEEIAKRPKIATTPTEGGGISYHAQSTSGVAVRVTQPAPQLLRNFTPELIEKLKELAGRGFKKLFITKYSTVPKFREVCFRVLEDKDLAKKFIGLCEVDSTPTVTVG